MPFDAYTARFGAHQGRITPVNHATSVGPEGVVDGTTASIVSAAAEPFVLADGDEFRVIVDHGAEQVMLFDEDDFATIATASAAEVAAAIQANIGPARILSGVEPFAFVDGDELTIRVDSGADQVATMETADFADIGAATAAEVAAVLAASWVAVTVSEIAGRVVVVSDSTGPTAQLEVTDGAANSELGFAEVPVYGSNGVVAADDGGNISLASATVGAFGCLRVRDPANDNANQVFNFSIEEVCGTTGSFSFVLGHDRIEMLDTLEPTDFVRITQSAVTMNDADILRVRGTLRVPDGMASGYDWRLAFIVGTYEEVIDLRSDDFADEFFQLIDLGVNVSQIASDDIAIELELRGPAGEVEVELPAAYLDIVTAEEGAADMLLLNRVPYPGQTGVPALVPTNVNLMIVSTNGDAVDASTIAVTIDGVLAYDAGSGGFQVGFSGSVTSATGPSSNDFSISIDVSAQTYASEQEITVEVEADTVGASASLADSYVFTIADTIPPTVVGASPRGTKVVRVSFSEDMLLDVSSVGALNSDNYTFDRLSQPAVEISAVSVAAVEGSTTSVDVLLDVEQTFNALYRVTVSNVEDDAGNAVVAPDNTADFNGFVCPIPAGRDFNLWRMIGEINRREDVTHELEAVLTILQDPLDLMLCAVDEWTDILDPDLAPENFIDAMLVSLGNPFRFDLDIADKRRLLSVLVAIYQSKGTAFGIIDAVFFFLGIEIEINPLNSFEDGWILGEGELGDDSYLYPGDSALRYSFEIISPVGLTEDQRSKMLSIADYMKVAHEHIVRIVEPELLNADDTWILGEGELGQTTALSQTI